MTTFDQKLEDEHVADLPDRFRADLSHFYLTQKKISKDKILSMIKKFRNDSEKQTRLRDWSQKSTVV